MFVLNLPDARVVGGDGSRGAAVTEADRYQAMRRNIPLPPGVEADGDYQHLQWYELDSVPDNWRFNDNGDWIGWSEN